MDRLINKGIYLASTFQLARFQHIIRTLWEVSNSHCVSVTKVIYKIIWDKGMTNIAIYQGLYWAVKVLQDGHINVIKEARDAELSNKELYNKSYRTTIESLLS